MVGTNNYPSRVVVVAMNDEDGHRDIEVGVFKVDLLEVGKVDGLVRHNVQVDVTRAKTVFPYQLHCPEHCSPAGFVVMKQVSTVQHEINLHMLNMVVKYGP